MEQFITQLEHHSYRNKYFCFENKDMIHSFDVKTTYTHVTF